MRSLRSTVDVDLPGFTIENQRDGSLALVRARPPLDARVVMAACALASVAVPFLASFVVGEDAAWTIAFMLWIIVPFAFLLLALSDVERPTRVVVARRVVVGAKGSDGNPAVLVDDRSWPTGEGVAAVVFRREYRTKNGTFTRYGVFLAMPDAVVELMPRGDERAARTLQAALCEKMQQPPIEALHWRRDPEGELWFVWIAIVVVCAALAPGVAPVSAWLPFGRAWLLLDGAWVAVVSWVGWRVLGAVLKKEGPALLRHVRAAVTRERDPAAAPDPDDDD